MDDQEEKHDELPVYEVEFIPVERRLQDRRSNPPSGAVDIERRQQGRRKTDPASADDPSPETAPPELPPPDKK